MTAGRSRRRTGWLVGTAIVAVAAVGVAAGCGTDSDDGDDLGDRQVEVVTTTNFITDMAEEIGGDRVEVTGLMGPGVDPHLYKASASDVSTLRGADVIFYNGLELEGRMTDLLVELAGDTETVAVTRDVPEDELREPSEFEGKFDPHIWFDVPLWSATVQTIADTYAEVDPEHADEYQERADAYEAELEALDAEVRDMLEGIPEEQRVLVTSHDAFGYFGEEYGFEVAPIQGTSTATEATTADIDRVSDLIADRGLSAVFIESSVSPQTIEAVLEAAERKGQTARVAGELFADAAGEAGTEEGTYIGMVRSNATAVADGLGSPAAE